jgi:hypothetical protein
MANKATIDARVKIAAGGASGSYGRIITIDTARWSADVRLDDGRVAKHVPMKHFDVIEEATITDRDKLVDRIRKLLAKAKSAAEIGSEAEAATFAAAAQKMLAKYKLEMSDIEFTTMEREEPVGDERVAGTGKRAREAWAERLASIVARAHYCRILVISGSDDIMLVGRPTDRAVASYVFTTLRAFADRQSDKDARTFRKRQRSQLGATVGENRNFRAAWLNAFVTRISERYEAEQREMARAAKTAGTSLVRLSNALAVVDDEMERRRRSGASGKVKGTRTRTSSNDAGHRAGRAAGDAATIRGTGLDAGSSMARKQLS